ncbi:MAG: restriction endonuclease subunit S [Pseudomonadota bacterium]|nr:restriction endonuclease subunit S [Pseudomonadota bacterium]
MEKQKCPEIRFSGFDGKWIQRNWRDTVEISTNMVDPRSNEYGELFHIGPGNIKSFSGQFYDNVLKVKDSNLISGKFYFRKGDIIYGKINPQLAKYVIAPFEGLASADAYVLNTKNGVVQNYLYAILQTNDFYKYTVSVSSRTGMPKINRDELNIYNYFSPSEAEQTLIGEFFQNLDQSITLHEKKLAQTQNFKKAMLEKMFPKQGSQRPEIRLKGFSDDWEERQLKDISFKVIEKNSERLYTETFTNSAQFGVISQRDFFDKDISNTSNIGGYYVVKDNDFIYNPRISNFAPVGPVKRNKLGRTGVVSPLYFVFRTHDVDHKFLEVYFETSVWHKFMFLNGDTGARSDRLAIKDTIFMEMPIYSPSFEEQQKVGQFFKQLDDAINLQKQQLQTVKNLKQALLEKMFV